MEVSVEYLGRTKFEVFARGHRVICDQPIENDGADEGMSPSEFLLASLATCAGYYATQYLKTRSLPTEDLKVRVTAIKGVQPARLTSFEIEVSYTVWMNVTRRALPALDGPLDSQHPVAKSAHRDHDKCRRARAGLVGNHVTSTRLPLSEGQAEVDRARIWLIRQ